MTLISKNIYIDKLDHVVKKYNNKYLSTIKMKPVDINQTHILTLVKKINNKNPKFKVGGIPTGYTPNWWWWYMGETLWRHRFFLNGLLRQ